VKANFQINPFICIIKYNAIYDTKQQQQNIAKEATSNITHKHILRLVIDLASLHLTNENV